MTLPAIGLMIAAAWAARMWPAQRRNALLAISLTALFALHADQGVYAAAVLSGAAVTLVVGVWLIVTEQAAPTWTTPEGRKRAALILIMAVIGVFAALKLPMAGQVGAIFSLPSGWAWIGFSYLAFRLLHVLLDYRIGRAPGLSLPDFALYALFFPAIPAGPIARVEVFAKELRATPGPLTPALRRLMRGVFKKFVLADGLALFALSEALAADARTGGIGAAAALWIAVYAYALRLFWDFSGYTDIAIGIGMVAGIKLPENFESPYLKSNLNAFWNNWHITLSMWFRAYVFMPISRTLMSTRLRSQREIVVLIAQVSTMVLIGLWHGAALNFVLWGVWHGVGLWVWRQYAERTHDWTAYLAERPRLQRLIRAGGVVATFHYVCIGWVFFALPAPDLIGKVLLGLIGRAA